MENPTLLQELQNAYTNSFAEEASLVARLEEIRKQRSYQEGGIQALKLQEERDSKAQKQEVKQLEEKKSK